MAKRDRVAIVLQSPVSIAGGPQRVPWDVIKIEPPGVQRDIEPHKPLEVTFRVSSTRSGMIALIENCAGCRDDPGEVFEAGELFD